MDGNLEGTFSTDVGSESKAISLSPTPERNVLYYLQLEATCFRLFTSRKTGCCKKNGHVISKWKVFWKALDRFAFREIRDTQPAIPFMVD